MSANGQTTVLGGNRDKEGKKNCFWSSVMLQRDFFFLCGW